MLPQQQQEIEKRKTDGEWEMEQKQVHVSACMTESTKEIETKCVHKRQTNKADLRNENARIYINQPTKLKKNTFDATLNAYSYNYRVSPPPPPPQHTKSI